MISWLKKNLKYIVPTIFVALFFIVPQIVSAAVPCWLWGFTTDCVVDKIAGSDTITGFGAGLLDGLLHIFGLFLSLAGILLDLVVSLTILDARAIIEGGDGLPGLGAIDLAWRTIRDVINILFVFVLLYISINIILDSWGNSTYNKSLIPKVIIAALLINFSLFFTKVVFDISNVITFEFYKVTATLVPKTNPNESTITIPTRGLTAAIMHGLELGKIVNDEGKLGTALRGTSGTYALFATLLGIVTILVAAFIFLVMAIMLLARFIIFIALMVTSPIAFLGPLFPALKSHAEQWQKALVSQATFPPIFFLMMLVVVLIITDPGFKTALTPPAPTGGGSEIAGYLGGLANVFLQYAIVIGLCVIALVVSKKTASQTGDAFKSLVGKISGGAAFVGRNTVGRAANRFVNSSAVGNLANSNNALGRVAGRGMILAGDKVRTSSFDVRGGNRVANALGVEAKEFGKVGVPGGFIQARETYRKERTEEAKKRAELYADSKARTTLRSQIKNAQDEEGKRKAQDALREMEGKNTEARKQLAEASEKLTAKQREEADTATRVIAAQEKYIAKIEREAQLETNPTKQAELQAKAERAQKQLDTYVTETRSGEGGAIGAYIDAKKAVAGSQKMGPGALNAAKQALGEEMTASWFRGERSAGEELRKGKDRTDQELYDEAMQKMRDRAKKEAAATTAPAPAKKTKEESAEEEAKATLREMREKSSVRPEEL